jgi:hypothetical protein
MLACKRKEVEEKRNPGFEMLFRVNNFQKATWYRESRKNKMRMGRWCSNLVQTAKTLYRKFKQIFLEIKLSGLVPNSFIGVQ